MRDRVDLLIGKPIDPGAGRASDVARIDSLYQAAGYYLAKVQRRDDRRGRRRDDLLFRVDEGRRLAISGVDVDGNKALSDKDDRRRDEHQAGGILLVAQGRVRRGQVRRDDLAKNDPALYASKGYIDAQVVKDTLMVDRDTRQRRSFDITVQRRTAVPDRRLRGERREAHFSSEDIARFYPFGDKPTTRHRRR